MTEDAPAELPAPLGEEDGEGDVGGESHKDDDADPWRELVGDEHRGKDDVDHLDEAIMSTSQPLRRIGFVSGALGRRRNQGGRGA